MDKNTLKLITVGTAVGFALTMGMNAWADKTDTATQNQLPLKEIRQFTDVFGAIKSFYVDPVGDKKLLEQALTGMVSGLIPTPPIWMPKASRTCRKGLKASSAASASR